MENNTKQNNFTSIIILTWNNLRYTKECIESIREHTNKELYEIIVVDNNSTDGTVDWLKGETDLKCIFNKTNNGFSKGNNQGIEIAIGDSILFLNNDVVATPNWLFNLRTALFSSEGVGAVGPLTNYAFGQAIAVPYPLEDMSEMTKFAKDNNISNPTGWEEKLKLIGFCMLVKMDIVKKIGGLDESFSPAHFEDDDYCYRILSEGYKILLCRDTFVHHYGSKSIITLPNNGTESADKGRITFYKKWGFDSITASISKYDIVNLINEPLDKALNILEIGCGCGGTLLCCKYKFKNSNLYGVEKNSNSAKFSSTFASVLNIDLDIDELSFDKDFFDVIIISDILENFKNPIEILQNIKLHLKQGGKFITSNENKKFLEIGRQIKENKMIEEKEQIEKEKFTAEKKLKIFHTASFAPNSFGLYEAARDAFRADVLAGHDVYFVDIGYLENGERKYTPIGSIDDRAGFKLITSDPAELDNADVIIAHTMPNHDWIARNQVPIIYVVHDRPLYSFKITNDVKSFTNTSEVSLQPRVKKMLYFWPEFKPFWRTFPQEKHAVLDYPVVDQIRFSPEGEKHIIKDEHKGEWNILICDSWGREIDVFEIINGAIQAAIDMKNIKFHIYGVEAVDRKLPSQWNLLLQQLAKLGAIGEICGRTINMEQIYRSMDCVLTPHRIVTRIIGESLSCGIPVIAANGCKVTEYLCDPQDPQTVSDAIKRFINSDREQSKKNALEQSKKFSSENYSREMEKIYKEVLNKKKAEEKSIVKLHQIYYKEEQFSQLDKSLIPYNNIENLAPKECEFYIFLKEYMNGNIKDGDITGYFSWKFAQKSQISGENFKSFIENNPGNDLYFVNPFSFFTYIYYNTWNQGEAYHSGILDLAKDIFSKVGYDPNLLISQRHSINNSMFCSYFAGSKNFWDRYIAWCSPIYYYIKNNNDPEFQHKMFNAKLWGTLSYFPYIMERLVNTFINLPQNSDLKIIRYPSDIYTNSWVDIKKYITTFGNLINNIDERKEYTNDDLLFLQNMHRFQPITSKLKL